MEGLLRFTFKTGRWIEQVIVEVCVWVCVSSLAFSYTADISCDVDQLALKQRTGD